MAGMITKEKKKVYLRRAKRQAHRQFAPQRQLIRHQASQLRKQRSRDLASVDGAIQQFSDVVSQAQAGLADSGLKGRYLKQVGSELANRAADAAQSAPTLKAGIRQEYQPEFSSIRDALASSRIEQSQTAESTFRTMLEERKKAMAARAEEGGGNQRAIKIGLENVSLAHEQNMKLLATPDSELKDNPEALKEKAQLEAAMEDPDFYWRVVAQGAAGEGLDPLQARRAATLYQNQLNQGAVAGVEQGVLQAGMIGAGVLANQNPGLYELYRRLQGR